MEETQWFTQQVLECEGAMYRLAMSIVGNTSDAADAAQQAILIAYQHRSSLRQKESFRPWLMRILTRECYAIVRQRKRLTTLDDLPEQSCSGDREEGQELWQAVCDLNESLRSVVVLYYYEGFQSKEIGEMLGISQDAVKARLSRARKHLRVLLEGSE